MIINKNIRPRYGKVFWGQKKVWVAVIFGCHVVFFDADYTLGQGFLAALGAGLAFYVIASFFASDRKQIPILLWVFVGFYIYFIFPILFRGIGYGGITFSQMQEFGIVTESLLIMDAIMLSILVGNYCSRMLGRRDQSSCNGIRTKRELSVSYVVMVIASIAVILVSFSIAYLLRTPPWYMNILFQVFSVNILLLLWLYESRNRPGNQLYRASTLVFLCAAMAVALPTARMYLIVLPLVIFALFRMSENKQAPFKLAAIFVLLAILITPTKHIYRGQINFGAEQDYMELGAVIDVWKYSFDKVWSGESTNRKEDAGDQLVSRINYLAVLSAVVYRVPAEVPYSNGDTWAAAVKNFVPRAIWRDKPALTEVTNDYFNDQLGFQSELNARTTTLAFPLVADAYWAWGWVGVIISGLLLGAYTGIIERLYEVGNRRSIILSFILLISTQPATHFAGIFGGIPQAMISVYMVLFLLEQISRVRKQIV